MHVLDLDRERNGEQWDGVRGPHGYGTINDAGLLF